eukprot:sb/3465549/
MVQSSDDKTMTTYLQYERDNGDVFKIGDFVYLKSESELPFIARIDSIQKDKKGVWVYGPWFIRPAETKFYDTRPFYPNEVLMSNIQDRNHLNSVEGRCEVLTPKDYTTKAPLGFLSKDIYVCEYKYDEGEHRFSKLSEKNLYTRFVMFHVVQPEKRIVAVEDQIEPLECPNHAMTSLIYPSPTFPTFPNPRTPTITNHPSSTMGPTTHHQPLNITNHPLSPDEEEGEEEEEEGGTTSENRETTPEERHKPQQQAPPKMKHKLIKPNLLQPQQPIIKLQSPRPRKEPINKPRQLSKPRQRQLQPNPGAQILEVPADFTPIANNDTLTTTPRVPTPQTAMLCRWSTCEKVFEKSEDFFRHAINTQTHLRGGDDNPEWKCRWKFCTDETGT